MKDYYATLGLNRGAQAADIKRAYRQLAVKYHPDKNPDPAVADLFKEITEAYNVLSDPQDKVMYDLKWSTPFITSTSAAPAPRHRDPAYRRPRPAVKVKSQRQRMYELMQDYLPYLSWICWAAVAVPSLFALDYVLPYRTINAEVASTYSVRGTRSNYMYTVLVTDQDESIKVYNALPIGSEITYKKTWLYGTIMELSSQGETNTMGYTYGAQGIMTLFLLAAGITGIYFRKNVEYHFNCCVTAGILLVINLFLLL